jgi:hypothetical protein
VTLIASAAAPATAAIHGAFAKSREIEIARENKKAELELAQRKEDYALRLQFLDRAVDPKYPPKDRQTILRFLEAVTADEKLKDWALGEQRLVAHEISMLEIAVADYAKRIAEAQARLAKLHDGTGADKTATVAAAHTVEELSAEERRLRERLSTAEAMLPEIPLDLNDGLGCETTPTVIAIGEKHQARPELYPLCLRGKKEILSRKNLILTFKVTGGLETVTCTCYVDTDKL